MTHLESLQLRLSNERARLAAAKTEGERNLRAVWVAQLEREIAGENAFAALQPMSVEDLLRELGNP